MSSFSCREVFRFVSAGVVSVTMGLPVVGAAEEKPLTPETIVEKRFEGKATVEFQVGEVSRW